MKRMSLFEFEDFHWFPGGLRECMTLYIAAMHRMLGTERILAPLLARALEAAATDRVWTSARGRRAHAGDHRTARRRPWPPAERDPHRPLPEHGRRRAHQRGGGRGAGPLPPEPGRRGPGPRRAPGRPDHGRQLPPHAPAGRAPHPPGRVREAAGALRARDQRQLPAALALVDGHPRRHADDAPADPLRPPAPAAAGAAHLRATRAPVAHRLGRGRVERAHVHRGGPAGAPGGTGGAGLPVGDPHPKAPGSPATMLTLVGLPRGSK